MRKGQTSRLLVENRYNIRFIHYAGFKAALERPPSPKYDRNNDISKEEAPHSQRKILRLQARCCCLCRRDSRIL
jgi:hypothetical protein